MRPRSLNEVAARALADPEAFADACLEFLDTFYLAHGDKEAQQAMLATAPETVGDPFKDAWIGAMGEHLAQRWDLEVPAWVMREVHDRLERPAFVPDSRALRGYLLVASPPAFRARLIFTGAEPMQRARFPKDEPERKVALPWPGRAARQRAGWPDPRQHPGAR